MDKFCSSCGKELRKADLTIWCRLCMRNYHARCWEKTGGCTTWGCPGKPSLESEEEKEQYKRCPYCGEKIIQFAVKCRYCRSVLDETLLSEPDNRSIESTAKSFRKDPILTCLLNLVFPGAGYMYLGKTGVGLIWFFIACAAWFFTRGLGMVLVYFWIMYDSTRQAVAMNRRELKNKSL